MVTNGERRRDDPFGRFRVVTESMGDGRAIHYYEWPDEAVDQDLPETETPAHDGSDAGDLSGKSTGAADE